MLASKVCTLGLSALLLAGCASLPDARPPAALQQALTQAGLPASSLGLVAYPLEGRPAQGLSLQGERVMQTGSTMKLLTAMVALDRLGPNSRARSELLAEATPRAGVLEGPLYLRGGADADLDWGALWLMLRELREQGVQVLQGGLVVDRSLFEPSRIDIDAPPFDESPEFPYNTLPDALNLNNALITLQLSADGEALGARLFPAWPGLRVDASGLQLADRPCGDWESGWQPPRLRQDAEGQVLLLGGSFPRHCRIVQAFNSFERQGVTAAAVRQIWQELGGQLGGPLLEGRTPAGALRLASHQDRPLAELLRGLMKRSDNLQARLLFLRLAALGPAGQPSAAAAARVVHDWVQAQGLSSEGLVLENGSGLSRREALRPALLAALLARSGRGPHAPELLASLPVAGVDGTLARRFKGSPVQGRARLKTGTLRDVVGLAGYVPDADGRTWVLVALINDPQAAARGRPVLDAAVEWVAQQRR